MLQTFDIIIATQALLDTSETMQLLSGYVELVVQIKWLLIQIVGSCSTTILKRMAADLRLDNILISQIVMQLRYMWCEEWYIHVQF